MTSHNHRTRISFLCRDLASRESSQVHAMWSSCKSIPGDGERYTSLARCNGHCLAAMVLEGLKGLRGILSIWNVEGVYPKYCQMILVKNPNFKTRDVTAKTLKFDLDIDSQKLQSQKEVYHYELRHIVFQHVSTNIFQGRAITFQAASLTRKGPLNRLVFHFAGFVSAFHVSNIPCPINTRRSNRLQNGCWRHLPWRWFRGGQRYSESHRAALQTTYKNQWVQMVWCVESRNWTYLSLLRSWMNELTSEILNEAKSTETKEAVVAAQVEVQKSRNKEFISSFSRLRLCFCV